MILQEWLDQNEKLCQEATPGPWIIDDRDESQDYGHFRVITDESSPWEIAWGCGGPDALGLYDLDAEEKGNMKFIAASRLSLPTALKIIRDFAERIGECDAAIAAEQIINEVKL